MTNNNVVKEILIKGILAIQEWFPKRYSYPLHSIFSQLTLSKKHQLASDYKLPPAYLSGDIVYPGKNDPQYVERVWPEKEWNKIITLKPGELRDMGINQLLFLIEKFGVFAPTKNEDNTVSIYDYYKFEAAQEAIQTLLPTDPDEPPYLLIAGDISGIQDFLYTISSQDALKTLRARSFFLEILTEHLVDRVLAIESLARVNLIYSGGGVFYILAPNTSKVKEELNRLKIDFNKWLYDEFGTKLFLCIAWAELSELKDITQPWTEISQSFFIEKQHKFFDLVKDGNIFELNGKEPTREECDICHRDDLGLGRLQPVDNGYRCEFCSNMVEIGSKLPQVCFVYKSRTQPTNYSYFQIEDVFYGMIEKDKRLPQEHVGLWWIFSANQINDTDAIPLYIGNHQRLMKDIPDYLRKGKEDKLKALEQEREVGDTQNIDEVEKELVALKDDSPASFEWLAKCSSGFERIGALRMDVDNLGKLFNKGFSEQASIFHFSALSRTFTYFFKIYINSICCGRLNGIEPSNFLKKEIGSGTGRHLTIIYSGGDDLFLIGAWSEVAELAIDLGKAFKQYVGQHPDVTLSAGMTLHAPKFPLYQIASLSGKALKEAKGNIEPCSLDMCHEDWSKCSLKDGGLCTKKDSLSLFYTPELSAEARSLKERPEVKSSPDKSRIKTALKWEEIEECLIKQVELFANLDNSILKHEDRASNQPLSLEIEQKVLPRGFVFKLLELIQIWQTEGKLYLPRMAWIMNKAQLGLERVPGKINYYQQFMERIYHFDSERMASLHIPLTWVESLMRRGRKKTEVDVDKEESLMKGGKKDG